MHPISQLDRQAQHYKAVRARLFAAPPVKNISVKPKPQILMVRDYDHHITTWKNWLRFMDEIRLSKTAASFTVSAPNYQYETTFKLTEDANDLIVRRSMKQICLDVLQRFPGVTFAEVVGRHRSRDIVRARQECMFEIYTERKDLSFPRVGVFFGGRDHTTVLHAVHKIKAERERDAA